MLHLRARHPARSESEQEHLSFAAKRNYHYGSDYFVVYYAAQTERVYSAAAVIAAHQLRYSEKERLSGQMSVSQCMRAKRVP